MTAPVLDNGLSVTLVYEFGKERILDFSMLAVAPELSKALMRAFIGVTAHTAPTSQEQSFTAIRRFSNFLEETQCGFALPLPASILIDFRNWLLRSYPGKEGQVKSIARSTFAVITNLLLWIFRNLKGILAKKTNFVTPKLAADKPQRKTILQGDALKQILAVCYSDIEKIKEELLLGERLRIGDTLSEEEKELSVALKSLIKIGKSFEVPIEQDLIKKYPKQRGVVRKLGGHRYINRILWISPETILPFYLAILIQSSGNPASILSLDLDCVRAHPLRSDIEQLLWNKNRSGREQKVDFPKEKAWTAPSLVRLLSDLTTTVRNQCNDLQGAKLFVSRSGQCRYGVTTLSNLHLQLKKFIKRHDLPSFSFYDLRRAGALQHHLAGGTIEAAKLRLNHKSIATTGLYTGLSDRGTSHQETIRRFQGELLYESLHERRRDNASPDQGPNSQGSADTVFGFRCKDPNSGIAPGSIRGSACMQFSRCATCPGALIPLDEPRVVANLIAALTALNDAHERSLKEGWWPRFQHLYEPTRQILMAELLPAIPHEVMQEARSLPLTLSIPWLE